MKNSVVTIYSVLVILVLVLITGWIGYNYYAGSQANQTLFQDNVDSVNHEIVALLKQTEDPGSSAFKSGMEVIAGKNSRIKGILIYSQDKKLFYNRVESRNNSLIDNLQINENYLLEKMNNDSYSPPFGISWEKLPLTAVKGIPLEIAYLYETFSPVQIYESLLLALYVVAGLFALTLLFLFITSLQEKKNGIEKNDDFFEPPAHDFEDNHFEQNDEEGNDLDFQDDPNEPDSMDFDMPGEDEPDSMDFDMPEEDEPDSMDFDMPGEDEPDSMDFDMPGEDEPDSMDFDLPEEDDSEEEDLEDYPAEMAELSDIDDLDEKDDSSEDDMDFDLSDLEEEDIQDDDFTGTDFDLSEDTEDDLDGGGDLFEDDFTDLEDESDNSDDEPSEQDEEKQKLYSPRSNVCWEDFIEERLTRELDRAASENEDISFVYLRDQSVQSDENYALFSEVLTGDFPYRDLIFEWGDQGFAMILPNADLVETLEKLDVFVNEQHDRDIRVGATSRNGRLLDKEQLIEEASSAIQRTSLENKIIGFRADPERYRDVLNRK